jgi:putative flavoprotein involved in K+ transport
VLERGEIASSWRHQRWDSLRLLTPNRQSRLPGHAYAGDDPDGFMSMPEVVDFISGYATVIDAPVRTQTAVTRVTPAERGYRVETSQGEIGCRRLVIATGACNVPALPPLRAGVPESIVNLTPFDYRNPGDLPDGNGRSARTRDPAVGPPRRACRR